MNTRPSLGAQQGQASAHAIAVIGMSCVFPGAPDIEAFWSLLEQGNCAVKPVPPERWDSAALPTAAYAGFIDDAACFDPAFFGISPKEAAALDPRQRLTLQLAWWALEDGGIAADNLKQSRLGVFIGAVNGEFLGNFAHTDDIEAHMGIGMSNAVIANRISHVLGLRGPSMAIDTACSSSLVAVHQACRSLQAGDADMALAGGVSLMLRPDSSVALGKGNMLAPDGLCKTFDASANGYGRGEGGGLVLLKRLGDALADGDRIHAIIRGSAINHDGVSNGITAPNGLAQENLISAALADAGLQPQAIQYVEAHGTGTLLGDPTETRALGRSLGQHPRQTPVLLGSVKTNIGHLEAAAGIAGLIKLILALKNKKIPASLHYRQPNPHIQFEQLRLQVVAKTRDWPVNPESGDRLGSVSAFGFGGANCHVVVQEFTVSGEPGRDENKAPDFLLLSASGSEALQMLVKQTIAKLHQETGTNFPAICTLSRHGRAQLRHRLAVVASSREEAFQRLQAYQDKGFDEQVVTAIAARRAPKLAFLCTGQGAQRPGMARELFQFSSFRATMAEADAVLPWPLSQLLLNSDVCIDQTAYTQAALLAVGVGLARLLAEFGVRPHILAGHSLGEYTAAVIAGAISFQQALLLVAQRGRLMSAIRTTGAMAAVRASEQTVSRYLGDYSDSVGIAAINGAHSVTISGSREQVEQVCSRLEKDGIRVRALRVQAAFHSILLEPMLAEFEQVLQTIQWQPLQIPVTSNLSGELLPVGHVYDTHYWICHTRQAVRFADNLAELGKAGIDVAIELGAMPMLSGMLEDHTADIRTLSCLTPTQPDGKALLLCVSHLHTLGVRLDFQPDSACAPGDALPLYPFSKDVFPLRLGIDSFSLGDNPARTTARQDHAAEGLALTKNSPATLEQTDIRQRIMTIVANLLAADVNKVDACAPLLEIGADSLILMQAVGRIENEFSVRIPVRAFFENLSTIDAVAAHLAQHLAKQQDIVSATAHQVDAASASGHQKNNLIVNHHANSNLSEAQRLHLQQFSLRYCERTAKSKQHAQHYRRVLADSRASAGFRFSTKEMLYPIVGQRAGGSKIWDIDGNEYIDISMGFGVQLFGHEPDFLKAAIAESLSRGIRIGPQSDMAGQVAELISELTGVERVAFCSTGTEAVMTALRLARTFTGRQKIAIFRDSYHGHFDGVLGEANDDPWLVVPRVAGITPGMVGDLAIFEYGSAMALELLRGRLHEFAAVLVEPVQSRNPGLQPQAFLQSLRGMTRAAGSLLIFDEVLVGFRIHPGGAQAYFDVKADLVTYGKIVGGGLPIGVIAGRADIMAGIDGGQWQYGDSSFPAAESTFFAGTFNKHPLAMAAAHAVLGEIKRQGSACYQKLNDNTARLTSGLDKIFMAAGAPVHMKNFGSLFRFVFTENLDPFFYHLLYRGLYVWEGRNLFLSTAHTDDDVASILERVEQSVAALQQADFIRPAQPTTSATESGQVEKCLPLSKAQRQLATLAALSDQGSAAYVISVALDLRGEIDHDRICAVFSQLVQRHDALRAAIDLEAGVQKIIPHIAVHLRRRTVMASALDAALQECVSEGFELMRHGAFRLDLFELEPGHAVLLFAAHHAFIDGQSVQILFEEFAALLNDQRLSAKPDYELLAQRMADAGTSENDLPHKKYWLQKLEDVPTGIDLPFTRARPGVRAFQGGRLVRELDQHPLRQLEQKATRQGMSLMMALTAAFAASLRRAGAGQDILLGIPYSGRDAALEHTLGYCAHLLPLRLMVPAQATTGDVLAEVKQGFLDAFSHANYPLSQLVEDLGVTRDLARPPLINVTFNIDRLAAIPALPGMTVQTYSVPVRHTRFDIACNVIAWQGGARVELDYDSQIYDDSHMQALLESFVAMAARMAEDDQPFDDRASIRTHWLPAQTATEIVPDLLARFRQAALLDGQAVAVRLDAGDSLTRRQLDVWSDRLALDIFHLTKSHHPTGPVLLLFERGLAFPAAMLAAWKSGNAYLPLDNTLPAGRLLDLIRQANPCCVLMHEMHDGDKQRIIASALQEWRTPVLSLSVEPVRLNLPSHQALALPILRPESCAYQLFTSGSTGKPKLVAVPHRAVQHYLDSIVTAFDLKTGLHYAVVSTFAADLGLTAVLPALFHAGCLTIVSHAVARDADACAALMRQRPVDVLKIVPSHLEALLSAGEQQQILPQTHLILGGETASPQLLQKLLAAHPACRIFNHFGPTEATIGVMTGEWLGDLSGIRFSQPLGRNRVHILDAGGHACAVGETGEIFLSGPGLALGYAGVPEDGASPFQTRDVGAGIERLYRTGDLAILHEDGGIQILGRKDEQLKIRGYRIEPAEIIAALTAQRNVAAATVVLHQPEPKNAGLPYLLAYVVAVDQSKPIDGADLLNNLRLSLPEYMLPKAVLTVAGLPYTANGKLDRNALPTLPDELAETGVTPAAGESETLLLTIWRDLLRRENLSLQTNFFQSGGDSILAIQMVSRIRQAGWMVKAMDLFSYPVLSDFAKRMTPIGAGIGLLAKTLVKPEGECLLLPAQARLYEHMRVFPAHYNLSVLMETASWVTADMAENALQALLEQHHALSLSFTGEKGIPSAHFTYSRKKTILHWKKDHVSLQASLRPDLGDLIAASWTPASDERPACLLLVVHHLVCDGISMQILLQDLRANLLELKAGRRLTLQAGTVSIQAWASNLQHQARQDVLLEQAQYWETCTSIPVPDLPVMRDQENIADTAEQAQSMAVLSPADTRQFIQGKQGAMAEDILIAALTLTLGDWTGEALAYLELEGHGRQLDQDDLDTSRTVGWFTSRYPAWFDLSDVTLDDAAQAIAEQRRDIPSHGADYGLLRYLGPDSVRSRLAKGQMPEISLNYMGQITVPPEDAFTLLSWSPDRTDRGPERASYLPRLHKLAIEAFIIDGQLHMLWQYDAHNYPEQEMNGLARKMAACISTLLANDAAIKTEHGREELA